MDKDMYARVSNGIDFLTDYFGSIHAWINRIDLGTLDLYSISSCVIGQLFGTYNYELWDANGDDPFSGHRYGFDDKEERYSELTDTWEIVIANLRSVLK